MTKKGPGRPRKHTGGREIKSLSLSPVAAEWLERQPNQSAAVEALIMGHIDPQVDLVVGRNPDLLPFLQEIGVASPEAEQIEHATIEDVEGMVIAGALPLHLACRAEAVVQVDFLASPEERGRLSLDIMRWLWERGKVDIGVYRVEKLS